MIDKEFKDGDILRAQDLNKIIENHNNLETIIENISVSVDDNIGTPSVSVSKNDSNLSVSFSNLKGEKGDPGPSGVSGEGVVVINDFSSSLPEDTVDSVQVAGAIATKKISDEIRGTSLSIDDFSIKSSKYMLNYTGKASTGAGFSYNYPLKKGDIVSIDTESSCNICLLSSNESIIYGYSINTKNTWGNGTILGINLINNSHSYSIIEDCYLYVAINTTNPFPRVTLYRGLISEVKNNREYLDQLGELLNIESYINMTPGVWKVGTLDSDHIYSTPSLDVYSTHNFLFNNTYTTLPKGSYRVFAKIKLDADSVYYFNTRFEAGNTSELKDLRSGEIHTIDFGIIETTSETPYIRLFFSSLRDENMVSVTKKTTVTARVYGVYMIKDGYDIPTEITRFIDYTNYYTKFSNLSVQSVLSVKAEYAEKSSESDYSLLSERTNKLNTSLKDKLIGFYGDSLITYISEPIKSLGAYLGARTALVGQGGGKIGNNDSSVKQGFLTLERLALLPHDMSVLVIYAGANDNLEEKVDGIYQVTDNLVGSMEDEPLEIADMMNYRVTNSNVSTINTPGRARTFYQGMKTLLRNVMALFPNTQIIFVAKHKSYYYLRPDGTYGDMSKLLRKRDDDIKNKAILDVCAEYSVPVCNLYINSGVNDHNARTTLIDSAGVAVHPKSKTGAREANLILTTILQNVDLFDSGSYTSFPDDDMKEMRRWVVDLRPENPDAMTLTSAIEKFNQYCTTNEIEIKNNMYLVFKEGNLSVGYHLKNKDNISSTASWEKWDIQTIIDPNEGGN